MAGGRRLIYALSGRDGEPRAILMGWFDHGECERRFSYSAIDRSIESRVPVPILMDL